MVAKNNNSKRGERKKVNQCFPVPAQVPNRLFYQPHRNPKISSALECCKNFESISKALSTVPHTTRLYTLLPCPPPDRANKRNKDRHDFRRKTKSSFWKKASRAPGGRTLHTEDSGLDFGRERSLGHAANLSRALPPSPRRTHALPERGPGRPRADSWLTVRSRRAGDLTVRLPQLPPRPRPAGSRKWRVGRQHAGRGVTGSDASPFHSPSGFGSVLGLLGLRRGSAPRGVSGGAVGWAGCRPPPPRRATA